LIELPSLRAIVVTGSGISENRSEVLVTAYAGAGLAAFYRVADNRRGVFRPQARTVSARFLEGVQPAREFTAGLPQKQLGFLDNRSLDSLVTPEFEGRQAYAGGRVYAGDVRR